MTVKKIFTKFIFSIVLFFILTIPCYAKEPKVLDYNEAERTLKVIIDGKEYNLPVPIEETENLQAESLQDIQVDATEEISIQDKTGVTLDGRASKKKRKRYALGPASARVGARLYNIPSDNLLRKKGVRFDFTHRFSGPIKEETSNDLYGLDTFSYTGIGLYYGITDYLEAHAFRSSLTDASEVGLKLRLLRESRKFGEGSPFGLTLSSGFQNDNIQNSLDFFIQPIFTKVIIPKWLKVYMAPTWADKSSTIGTSSSLSAIFFPSTDPKGRSFSRSASTWALPIGGALQVVPDRVSLIGEYTPVLGGYKEVKNGWALGLQILSRLETHVWTIGVSNVPYSTFGQFVVGAPSNDLHIGFNITAKIK